MYLIIFSVIIGIFIGSLTNALAIKMLFRPYQPWKIGHRTIPFTPGLIPKRREEIADQLGQLVENYLFTVEGLKDFITNSKVKEKLYTLIKNKLDAFKEQKMSVNKLLMITYGPNWKVELQKYTEETIVAILQKESIQSLTIDQIVSTLKIDINAYAEKISDRFINELQLFLRSPQGRQWIDTMIRSFFSNKGMLSFFASKLLDGDQLQEKLSDYLQQLLNHQKSKEAVRGFLLKEWEQLKERNLGETIDQYYLVLKPTIGDLLESKISELADLTLDVWIVRFEEKGWLEKSYNKGFDFSFDRLHLLFSYFSIAEVVRKEVNKFSLPKLEKMIIDVSRKELKMITYLGGVIGGLIGLIQGLIYQLL